MKKLTAALALAAAAFVAAPARAQATKIAVVDGSKILNESLEGKKTADALKKRWETEQERIKAEDDKFRALAEDYQKKKDSMSPEAVEEKEAELQGKQRKLRAMFESAQARLQQIGGRATDAFREKLRAFITNWSKTAGYDLVLNADAAFYNVPSADATDAVLKAFNDSYTNAGQPEVVLEEPKAEGAPAAAPAAKPAPKPAGAKPAAPAPKTGAPKSK